MSLPPLLNVGNDRSTRSPLQIYFDSSCSSTLRIILTEAPLLFLEVSAPEVADIVLFETDVIHDIRKSELYKNHKSKSLCITESDIPTFRLPGLYAANQRGILTSGRTKTINYFLSERDRPNPEVKRLVGQTNEKRYLYSFMGGTNSWARRRVFSTLKTTEDTLVESTDTYNHWSQPGGEKRQTAAQMQLRYAQVMAASKFTLCPRGCGLSSYRLFESMSLSVVPVIMSDNWRPIEGIDWSFAIHIPEKHIAETDRIVREHECEWQERGERGRSIYRAVLQPNVVAQLLFKQLHEVAASYNPQREAIMTLAAEARATYRELYWATYARLKQVALGASRITGVAIPVKMRQPDAPGPGPNSLGTEAPPS